MDIETAPDVSFIEHEATSPPTPVLVDEVTPQPATSTPVETDCDKNDEPASVVAEHLDDAILTLLGDAPKEETPVGKDIHSDIATRLMDVLQNGLKKELKDKITEEYPIPGNCQLFKSPILNPEVKAASSDILQKKDASIAARQGQVGVALSALTSAMDILAAEASDVNQTLLKHVSNACRLLCDSHYIDTKLRRSFLISTLNNKLKDTLKDSKRDKHLFGESLSESLKATKAITRSSQDLKSYIAKPKPVMRNNKSAHANNHLNWKQPQPNQQNANRKMISSTHRTAGSSSTAHRNEAQRKPTSSRVSRPHAHYKSQRRY